MTEILKNPSIACHFGYKLVDINYNPRQLIFEEILESGQKSKIVVDLLEGDRVIGADGCNSMVRKAMVSKSVGFSCKVIPWNYEFRVLFAESGKTFDGVDANVHYIIVITFDYRMLIIWQLLTIMEKKHLLWL